MSVEAVIESATLDKLIVAAPIATIIVLILLVGVIIAAYFQNKHIESLKKWIDDLKNNDN